jgi:hypothetical protein
MQRGCILVIFFLLIHLMLIRQHNNFSRRWYRLAYADDVIFYGGSTTQLRAGDYILLKPGFHVRASAKFLAIITSCNQQ